MAHSTKQGIQLLNGFQRLTRFSKGLGAQLPEAYKKFWKEWKMTQPAAVHYVPREEDWERDDITGQISPVQNIPLPLIDPPESHEGIWGGEAVIRGFRKRNKFTRRFPHFWVPVLRRSVVHSEILDEYMSVVVTDRTLQKIHECHGFDHYILKNLACDLRSELALTLKRKILQELLNGCPIHSANPSTQQRLLKDYRCYLEGYTPEEIEWYGYTFDEAIKKLLAQIRAENPSKPHKVEFRLKLIEQLKRSGIDGNEQQAIDATDTESKTEMKSSTLTATTTSSSSQHTGNHQTDWLSKINPFGSKKET